MFRIFQRGAQLLPARRWWQRWHPSGGSDAATTFFPFQMISITTEVNDFCTRVQWRILFNASAGISPRPKLNFFRNFALGWEALRIFAYPRSVWRAGKCSFRREPEAFRAAISSVFIHSVNILSDNSVKNIRRMRTRDGLADWHDVPPSFVGRTFRNRSNPLESGLTFDEGLGAVSVIIGAHFTVLQSRKRSTIDNDTHRKVSPSIPIHPSAFSALQLRRPEVLVALPAHVIRYRSHIIILQKKY